MLMCQPWVRVDKNLEILRNHGKGPLTSVRFIVRLGESRGDRIMGKVVTLLRSLWSVNYSIFPSLSGVGREYPHRPHVLDPRKLPRVDFSENDSKVPSFICRVPAIYWSPDPVSTEPSMWETRHGQWNGIWEFVDQTKYGTESRGQVKWWFWLSYPATGN